MNDYERVRERGDKRGRAPRNYWRICILMELPTYLHVARGPRHNSSPLLATVHAKEKNDASENSPRRDQTTATRRFARYTPFPWTIWRSDCFDARLTWHCSRA